MKKPELFHKTIGILVNAYMHGILTHSDACGCAVGNLIAANNNFKIVPSKEAKYGGEFVFLKQGNISHPDWCKIHSFGEMNEYVDDNEVFYNGKQQLISTGYNILQTCEIEAAFESTREKNDRHGYKGLMVVCDTLMQIHEATTEEIKEAKELFVKN